MATEGGLGEPGLPAHCWSSLAGHLHGLPHVATPHNNPPSEYRLPSCAACSLNASP